MAFQSPNLAALGWYNLGLTYSSSTLSVTAADGGTLSAANPGFITMKSNSGAMITLKITANQGFIDDTGASEIVGNLFGLTTGIAHANVIPFALYAVLDDSNANVAFMCSRNWGYSTSPATIGMPSSAIADSLQSMFSFDNVTAANYDSNSCLQIGSFRMTMSSSDDWTVAAFDDGDGIGNFQRGVRFTASTGQWGNSANSYFQPAGGTAPIFATQSLDYSVSNNGWFDALLNVAAPSTVGVGAVASSVGFPYSVETAVTGTVLSSAYGQYYSAAGTPSAAIVAQYNPATANQHTLAIYGTTVGRYMLQTDWSANTEGHVHFSGLMRR